MSETETQWERLELKYLSSLDRLEALRAGFRPYCEPDHEGGYVITTLYLDGPKLPFFQMVEANAFDRTKLRIRSYGSGPAFFELKRKTGEVIRKQRAAVPPESIAARADGLGIDPAGKGAQVLQNFAAQAARFGATPLVLVRYRREAWASELDRYARVTFDTAIEAAPADGFRFDLPDASFVPLDGGPGRSSPAVIELKCETKLPGWLAALVRAQDLKQIGFSKYARGVKALAVRGLLPIGVQAVGTPNG